MRNALYGNYDIKHATNTETKNIYMKSYKRK